MKTKDIEKRPNAQLLESFLSNKIILPVLKRKITNENVLSEFVILCYIFTRYLYNNKY